MKCVSLNVLDLAENKVTEVTKHGKRKLTYVDKDSKKHKRKEEESGKVWLVSFWLLSPFYHEKITLSN